MLVVANARAAVAPKAILRSFSAYSTSFHAESSAA